VLARLFDPCGRSPRAYLVPFFASLIFGTAAVVQGTQKWTPAWGFAAFFFAAATVLLVRFLAARRREAGQ
jgi:hypothetical protein